MPRRGASSAGRQASEQHPQETYEAFFDRVMPKALATGRRILGSAADAEDVAIEALARAYVSWESIGRYHHRDAWALRVAANVAYDQARKRSRSRRHEETVASPPELSETVELRACLVPLLRKLSNRQREVVILSHMVGLSHEEIAHLLGCSAGSVKVHARRGIEKLRSELPPGAFEEV